MLYLGKYGLAISCFTLASMDFLQADTCMSCGGAGVNTFLHPSNSSLRRPKILVASGVLFIHLCIQAAAACFVSHFWLAPFQQLKMIPLKAITEA